MRVLILGSTGMLGHKLYLECRERFDTWATVRRCPRFDVFDPDRVLSGVDATNFNSVVWAVQQASPEVVVNCIGIVRQKPQDLATTITVNAAFPHQVAALCRSTGRRLVHISTDCVFSGHKGGYDEADLPDPQDFYGRTKLLGEIGGEGCLTLRTSFIGRELAGDAGLLEWLISQRGKQIAGFTNVIFSGLTTAALSTIIADVLQTERALTHVYHVAAKPISKWELLSRLNDALNLGIDITPTKTVPCDRSLDASRFWVDGNPPTWDEMIAGFANDPTPYAKWRHE